LEISLLFSLLAANCLRYSLAT